MGHLSEVPGEVRGYTSGTESREETLARLARVSTNEQIPSTISAQELRKLHPVSMKEALGRLFPDAETAIKSNDFELLQLCMVHHTDGLIRASARGRVRTLYFQRRREQESHNQEMAA